MGVEQITKRLKCWKRRHAELMSVYNAMSQLTGADRYSTLFELIFDLWTAYTVATSELIGDKEEWLQWYEIDCDMGRAPADALHIATLAVQRYAEMHPRPSSVTQKQAALMIGVSGATLSRLVRAGKIKLNDVAGVPISEVDRVLAAG